MVQRYAKQNFYKINLDSFSRKGVKNSKKQERHTPADRSGSNPKNQKGGPVRKSLFFWLKL